MICGIFDGQKKRVKVPAERGSVPEKESVVVTARRKCSPHSTRPQRPCSVARPSKFPAHGNIASRLLVSCAYSGPAPPPELIRNHRSEILKINIGQFYCNTFHFTFKTLTQQNPTLEDQNSTKMNQKFIQNSKNGAIRRSSVKNPNNLQVKHFFYFQTKISIILNCLKQKK